MRVNYIGIMAGFIAFISLALPWWTLTASGQFIGTIVRLDFSIYLYKVTTSLMEFSSSITMEHWFGWATLTSIIIAGITAIVGSTIVGKNGKRILFVSGILALFSILIFVAGLQNLLAEAPPASGFPKVDLFSSGSYSYSGMSANYSAYLSFGFWLGLATAIVAFISISKHPVTPPEALMTPYARAQVLGTHDTRYCAYCGEQITMNTDFCSRCGRAQK